VGATTVGDRRRPREPARTPRGSVARPASWWVVGAVVVTQAGVAAAAGGAPVPSIASGLAGLGVLALWLVGRRMGRVCDDHEQVKQRLDDEEAHHRALLAHASDLTLVIADAHIAYQSPSTQRVLGYEEGSLLGLRYLDLVHPDDRADTIAFVRDLLDRPGGSGLVACRLRAADGRFVPVESSCRNLLDDPRIAGVVVTSRDVSERQALQRQLEHETLHDPMTGIANRALLLDRLQRTAARAARNGTRYAVLCIDLDDFKPINDTLGHLVGDAVLRATAQRIAGAVRTADTVARLGADVFAVLIEDHRDDTDPAKAASRILAAVSRPVDADGTLVEVTASIGIAADDGTLEGAAVLRNADIAMDLAKRAGKDRFELFEPAMHLHVVEQLQLEADLHQAIAAEQLHLHYQPIVELASRRIVALEALVRWDHPERGPISPGRFIPIAERTGLIVPVGRFVLREACRQLADWRARLPGAEGLTVNVNVSMRQLLVGDLVADTRRALDDSGLPPEALTLELTESSLAVDPDRTIASLHGLKALGVELAIDDFGTGYSSLAWLHRFPVDVLKIDRSFVSGVVSGEQSPAFVRAIVELGRALGLVTVAEGIEHDLELTRFRQLGCTLAQGFLLARPADAGSIERRLLDHLSDRPQVPAVAGRPR
jgi:diguanylate cyclase (GGDEF)-like protein/PAS domain S-box-containing protein